MVMWPNFQLTNTDKVWMYILQRCSQRKNISRAFVDWDNTARRKTRIAASL